MLPVFWYILLAATVAWVFLTYRLYGELRCNHPDLYEALGSPILFTKRNFIANSQILKFIFARDHGNNVMPNVERLCQGLRALFYIYIVCLAGCVILLGAKII